VFTGNSSRVLNLANGADEPLQFFLLQSLAPIKDATVDDDLLKLNEKLLILDLASDAPKYKLSSKRDFDGSVIISSDSDVNPFLPTSERSGEGYSLNQEGDDLTIQTPVGFEPDRQKQAEALAARPAEFKSRRIRMIWPSIARVDIGGLVTEVPGYFLGATLAGLYASLPPQQGHSELPIPGWVGLKYSNDYFNEEQLSLMTAGGMYIYVQDVEGGPIVCRKQYTTDTSGDITAESSITLVVDSFVKDIRKSVRPILGVNNLTTTTIEKVKLIINSISQRYINNQALKSATLNSIQPSKTPGDITTLEADMTLGVIGPFNLLRIVVNF
jgi:hypothetical protein